MHNKVIWSEGMFLQPQHLQQQERYFDFLMQQKGTSSPFFWGFFELEFDEALLEIGQIALKKCVCIFPDGTYLKAPTIDLLPLPLKFNPSSEETTLYLALPARQKGVAEVSSDNKDSRLRYRSDLVTIEDNTSTYIGTGIDIHVGRLALTILQGEKDLSGHVYLPIARVSQLSAEKAIVLDEDFIPPSLNVRSNERLRQYLEESLSFLHHHANLLANRLANIDEADSTAMQDMILLQLLNSYESRLTVLKSIPKLKPFDLYLVLFEFLGALSTHAHEGRRPPVINLYDHDSLEKSFPPLVENLKSYLSMALSQNSKQILLTHQDNLWTATILDESAFGADIILIATAQVPSDVLRSNLPSQLKIAPIDDIYDLVTHALTGISLTSLSAVPQKIPYYANAAYFVLDKENPYWKKLSITTPLAIHQGVEYPGLNLELWAVNYKKKK